MKRNHFLLALEDNAQGPVDVSAIIETDTLQPKPGVGEDKSLAEVNVDDLKADKTFGEDAEIADHDEIDTVAESQEHTLALEHLHHSAARFVRYASALEELVEQAEDRLEADQPLEAGETAMLTTALDASGIGEPLEEQVALESFGFDARVATESFIETLKERSSKVVDAIVAFADRMANEVSIRLKSFAAAFHKYPSQRIAPLKKKIGEVNGFSGRNFDNAKREKNIQGRIYAGSSSKTPVAAAKDALAAYEAAASFIDSRMATAVAQATRAFATDDASKVAAAVNKVLSTAKELAKSHSESSKFSTIGVHLGLDSLTSENATKAGFDKFKRVSHKPGYDNSLKIATEGDLKELDALAVKAGRVLAAKHNEVFEFLSSKVSLNALTGGRFGRRSYDRKEQKDEGRGEIAGNWNYMKLNAAYRVAMYAAAYAVSSVEMGLAEGLFRNANAAAAWIDASVAEAKEQRKKQGA